MAASRMLEGVKEPPTARFVLRFPSGRTSHLQRAEEEGRMESKQGTESFETIVIGGGQAGLATGYYLARRGVKFVILDANERTGDQWRSRWDSLRLFSEAHYDSLPGMRF